MSNAQSPAKFTPGPWQVVRIGVAFTLVENTAEGNRVAECPGFTGGISIFEREANARLIAAAPELLEACKQLIDAPHQEHFAVRLNDAEMAGLDAIKRAIAKAEGTSEGSGGVIRNT